MIKKSVTKVRKLIRSLGPGLITGAADDDPSGIATYSQTGAQFGYGLLWTALYILPFLVAIQEACARIGGVTGKGLAGVIRENYNKKILYFMVSLVVIANTINIGADIGAMAAAAALIIPIHFGALTLLFTAMTLTLEIFIPYKRYAVFLKWMCFFLFVYPIAVFVIEEPWGEILTASIVPHFELEYHYLFIIIAVLGTTISPYMFFWQASQVVEEAREAGFLRENQKPLIDASYINDLRIDNFTGMLFSEITTWAIIVVTATVLHSHGLTDITTSADAARALEPLVQTFPHSGYLAKLLFSVGIIGLGLIAVPVLAASAAYSISEAFNWKKGLNLEVRNAVGFYGVITIATLVGLCINFIGIDPVKALIYSAVINGLLSPPLIFIIAMIARDKKIMGEYRSGLISTFFVGSTFIGMSMAAITMCYTFFFST